METNSSIFIVNIIVSLAFIKYASRYGKSAIISLIVTQALLANILVLKQITLFGLNVTASDVFSISASFCIAVLKINYSSKDANYAIIISMVCMTFFAIVSRLHLNYIPNSNDFADSAYKILFSPNIRVVIASIFSYYLSQKINILILKLFSTYLRSSNYYLQLGISVLICQLFDTVFFSYFALYGIMDLSDIIIFSLIIKTISILIFSLLQPILIIKNKHDKI